MVIDDDIFLAYQYRSNRYHQLLDSLVNLVEFHQKEMK